jgi:hypothetical protein
MAPSLRELTDDDVLLGRGFPAIENEGNVRFRAEVRSRSAEYHAAYRRHTKDSIAREVVNTIQRRSGRFLTQLQAMPRNMQGLVIPARARVWKEADEAAVLTKAKQALRDHADGSKEERLNVRRRSAAGSGNLVLEWAPASPPMNGTFPTGIRSNSDENDSVSQSRSCVVPSLPQQPAPPFLGQDLGRLYFSLNSNLRATTTPSNSLLAGPSLHHGPVLAGPPTVASFLPQQTGMTPASFQRYLQQRLQSLRGNPFVGNAATGTFAGFGHAPVGGSNPLSSVSRSHELLTLASPIVALSSQSLQHQVLITSAQNTTGSRAESALDRGRQRASSSASRAVALPESLVLCEVEASLLKVLCSFGPPRWSREAREYAFKNSARTEGASLSHTWVDIGHQLQQKASYQAAAPPPAVSIFAGAPKELARLAIFLLGRCLDIIPQEVPTSGGSGVSPGGILDDATAKKGKFSKTAGTSRCLMHAHIFPLLHSPFYPDHHPLVKHALHLWAAEIGQCSHIDGRMVAGTLLETLEVVNHGATESMSSSSEGKPAMPVAAILSPDECATIVTTLTTLAQLRWVFEEHAMSTIYSMLSSQQVGGDTSRDYLLLKGVLQHGLVQELVFRLQGSSNMSASAGEIEARVVHLTGRLYKQLHAMRRQEDLSLLKRKYSNMMGI